jgi:riboflavin kinase
VILLVPIRKTLLGKPGDRWFDFADVLVSLVEFGGMNGYVRLSGSSLGSLLGISQQAAARRLIRACEAGFIDKRTTIIGYEYIISEKAKTQISNFILSYNATPKPVKIKTILVSGVGEGKFFLQLRGYKKQFEQLYGFKPYPGTLNLKATQNAFEQFRLFPSKVVNGFRTGGRAFGLVLTYKARMIFAKQTFDCVAIFPEISRYGDEIVELIAPVNLRKKMQLSDGDVVYIEPISD